jgi:diguanylate cyclase (GGDEF)-like protein/PAS domain S-box-containing protein
MPKQLNPIRISLLYAILAALWIVTSSSLLSFTVADSVVQNQIEIAKGLLFVVFTSALLFALLKYDHHVRALNEQRLLESDVNYRSLADSGPALVWTAGADKQCDYFNKVWLDFTGRSMEQELGNGWTEGIHPDDIKHCLSIYSQAFDKHQSFSMDYRLRRHDGNYRWIQDDGRPRYNAAGEFIGYIGYCLDITARKQTETQLQRLSNLYAALSQCNQAIVRCNNEAELFPQICRDAVNFGQMKMAWIGIIDTESQRVIPVASFGEGTEYLQDIQLSVDGNNLFSQGPTGISIRNDRPFWCQDFLNDPITEHWHEDGTRFGWGSSASLPLHRNGLVTGSLNVYAGEALAFDEAVQNLLLEMTMDISYAIDRFEQDRQRLALTDELKQTRARMDSIVNNIDQVIWSVDANTHQVIFLNAAAEIVFGKSVKDFFEHPGLWLQTVHPDDMNIALAYDHSIRVQGKCDAEYRVVHDNGDVHWISDHAWRVCDAGGNLLRLDGIASDITERKQAEADISKLAYYDTLTDLPNRSLLSDRVSQAISVSMRNHTPLVLMFLDLDHFKNINDTLGHSIGDQLLIKAAQRMKSAVREEDTVARPGGDEFILILLDTDASGAAHVADKLLAGLSEPYIIDTHELVVTPSIGIAMYPNDGHDFQTLAQRADAAMYRAKHEGRNGFRFYSPEMQANSARALLLENTLRRALELEQLQVHYQPQFCIHSGRIIGAEALVRWHHPELGIISPAEFIPIAENSGQIMSIGTWVLRTALKTYKHWIENGLAPMAIAVNLSAIQFRHTRLPDLISAILNELQLPPDTLELELTEGVAMDDPVSAIKIMDNLHARGIRMSVDDFGTGYSSLSYLKRFKIYKLKIDRSFVSDITEDPEDRAIVIAIINLSRSLGFKTIAEGVETEGQLAFLRENGCDEVQGYLFSKPLPAEQFVAFVRTHQAKDAVDSA